MTEYAIDHFNENLFAIMWSDIIENKDYNLILLNPSNAKYFKDTKMKMGYYEFEVKAFEEIEELSIIKGEKFLIHFPITSFAYKLMRRIRFKKLLHSKVLLSFNKQNHKTINFEVTEFNES